MKGDKIAVDKEKEGFVKATPGQSQAAVIRQAQQVAAELEKRLTSRRQLFERAPHR